MTDRLTATSSYVTSASKLILVYCEPKERATTADSYEYLYPQLVKIPHRAIKVVDSNYLKNKDWEHKTSLLVLPGGIFSKCEVYLEPKGLLKIINFAKNYQGRIFGICSWAYGLSQRSSYVTNTECIERDRSGSPFYLSHTFAEGPFIKAREHSFSLAESSRQTPFSLADSWESASFDTASLASGDGLVQVYSIKRERAMSSSFTRLGSTDSLSRLGSPEFFDGLFSRFSPSPTPSTASFSSPPPIAIQIWRPDRTSGPCHYLNGAKLIPLPSKTPITPFASFNAEGDELAIVGFSPDEGSCPGNVVLSSVHPEYGGASLGETPFDCPPLEEMYKELSSPEAKEFNSGLWTTIIDYLTTGESPS